MQKNYNFKAPAVQESTSFQDPFPEQVWESTYKYHSDGGIDDTNWRVATAIASAEDTEEKANFWATHFYDLLSNFKGVPGGRILANAGTDWEGTTMANCYVGPLPSSNLDSIEGIYAVLKDQANTLKSEGGWGMDFSWIRPRGSFIHGIGVESPGSIRFMELFDKSSEIVTSGSGLTPKHSKAKGKIRKGAMMASIGVWHPDVFEFITAKQTDNRLSKFNMSVNCTSEFMAKITALDAAEKRLRNRYADWQNTKEFQELDKWDLEFPDTSFEAYSSEWTGNLKEWKSKGYPVIVHETVSARKLWETIMQSTYNRNEPGVLFLDRANEFNPLNYQETILSTNPCGEQTLAPGGVCCLGNLNLTQFVNSDRTGFDLDRIRHYARILVRFLDNVNSVSNAPLPEYEASMRDKRRIGCGVMGWGSALFMLEVPFGSERAAELREQVMKTYSNALYEASIDLAEEKGKFKYCDPEKHANAKFIAQIGLSQEYVEKLRRVGIRNSSLVSNQPTGNTGIYANVISGGIEPVFMFEYIRTVICPTIPDEIRDVTPKFYEGVYEETEMFKWAKEGDESILRGEHDGVVYKIDRNRGLTREVLCEDYGVRFLKRIGRWDHSAPYAKSTLDLTVEDHVSDLEGFARYTDSACSKTCNLPNDYSFEDFKDLYLKVYATGVIKGFTTYRAGTMTSVLSAAKETASTESDEEEIILEEIQLPDSLPATLKTIRAEGRKWYLTVILNETQTRPVALFTHTNHHEKNVVATNAVASLLSLAIDKGIPERHIEQVLSKISGDTNTTKICRLISLNLRHGVLIRNVVSALEKVDCLVGSFVFHIRKFLATFIKDGEKVVGEKCQECGGESIVYEEGCKKCIQCGSSKCG